MVKSTDVLLPLCHTQCQCAFTLPGLLCDLVTQGISLLCLEKMDRGECRLPVSACAQCFHSTAERVDIAKQAQQQAVKFASYTRAR